MRDMLQRVVWGSIAYAASINVVAVGIAAFFLTIAGVWLDYTDAKLTSAVFQSLAAISGLLTVSGLWGRLKTRVSALSQLNADAQERGSFVERIGGRVDAGVFVVDCKQLLSAYGPVLQSTRRLHTSADHKQAGILNALAYLRTTFGLFAGMKERRNRSLFRRNPLAFLVSSTDGREPFNCCTSVLPMTSEGYATYLRSGVSDNRFPPDLVTPLGTPVEIAHIFMMAVDARSLRRAKTYTFDECVSVTLLMQVLALFDGSTHPIHCVCSVGDDIVPLLSQMGFRPSGAFNGDKGEMWAGRIQFVGNETAITEHVRRLRAVL